MSSAELPLKGSYWAEPGRLLAGPYPGEYDAAHTRENMQRLLAAGARCFISLMESREEGSTDRDHAPYVPVLEQEAGRISVPWQFHRFEIPDMGIPSSGAMDDILRCIDASVEARRPVYVHCWGGRGRTGTVVAAYLLRRGLATPANFLDVIASLRVDAKGRSPETDEQVAFVERYAGI